jgi:preprotein translocase subunit SecY
LFALLIGYRIPLPGINANYLHSVLSNLTNSGVGGFLNALTGSAFSRMSIFALSITPYITASILLQLLTVMIPSLEAMAKDGSVGHQKMEKLTFVVGAIIAIIEALGLAIGFGRKGLLEPYTWYMVLYATFVWTVGACFLIWVGQTITNKLIGNGTSLILLFNILTTIPSDIENIFTSLSGDSIWWVQLIIAVVMAIVICLVFAYVVVLNNAEKRIHITNSGKAGMRMGAANNNIMPLKLNMGGVMPIIFSSTIMSFPAMIAGFVGVESDSIASKIIGCFSQGNWFNPEAPIYTLGVLLFIPLTFAFSYFYSIISFNAKDIADNLRRGGSIINGIRPGQPTADYLKAQAKSMLWLGTSMLLVISLIPTIISGVFGISGLSFGGTTILIIVGVILEMKNTLIAQTSSVAYKSLIKKNKRGGIR